MKSALRLIVGFSMASVFAIAATSVAAQPAAELKILATDPAPDALLARQQPFFVRFEAKGAAPLAISVSGWFKGQAVLDDGGTSAPAQLPAGGIGVVSFFYWSDKPTKIDEVRLHVADARTGALVNDYAFPVALTWLSDDPPPREVPAWVSAWQQGQKAKTTAAPDSASEPQTAWWSGVAGGALLMAMIAGWWWRRRRDARGAPADDALPR